MIEIDTKRIELYLRIYQPSYRFLKKLEINYPIISGDFIVPPTFYTLKELDHLSDVETQFCLNQLAYVGISEAIKKEQILKEMGGRFGKIPYGEAVIGKSEKKFREKIDPSKNIHGELEVKRIFNLEDKIIAMTLFDFEKGKCFGKLNIALIRDKRYKK
jgi:hypothetical protein